MPARLIRKAGLNPALVAYVLVFLWLVVVSLLVRNASDQANQAALKSCQAANTIRRILRYSYAHLAVIPGETAAEHAQRLASHKRIVHELHKISCEE